MVDESSAIAGARTASVVYAVLALLFGVAFALLTPPFHVPDEVGHYWRTEAMVGGAVMPPIVDGQPRAPVPAGVRSFVASIWKDPLGDPPPRFSRADFRTAARVPLGRDEPVTVTFPAQYTPFPYLPQLVACGLGRVTNARPLISFHAGRIANVVAMVLLFVAAIRAFPPAAPLLAAVGLLPMTLFMAGSFSPDAVTIAIVVYVTAACLGLLTSDEPIDGRQSRGLIAAAFGVALSKAVYFLPAALVLLVSRRRFTSRRALLQVKAGVLVAVVAGLAISGWVLRHGALAARKDAVTDPHAQLQRVLAAPADFLRIAASDYLHHGHQYATHFVGNLGWLNIPLPALAVNGAIIFLALLVLTTRIRFTAMQRAIAFVLGICTLLVISLSQYVVWTPVGAETIEGIQGRYFLPVSLLLFAPFAAIRRDPLPRRVTVACVAVAAAVLNVLALRAIVTRYY